MTGHILSLEEDPKRVAEFELAIESPGHHLVNFESFFAALSYMNQHRVDMVLCDVHLEHASGFEFLKEIRNHPLGKNIPFLFYCIEPSDLTKSLVKSILVAADRLGATDVIVMERFKAGELCHEVEKYLPERIERKCA